ncbi:hypothetical protein [Nitratifractor salsuginis]|uniref:Uncharacterized protein n=1 Tax=Nitratifractor salsuginis (strain DSM 16511 / JCM 12458 / E9I37-1) TaxID=749222 RepID=E6WZ34_NITSE|nr:hypothetical protein [Nitratifractor salsuginis]ADV45484.1 hypothetical protein Nitsa_0212 [Nitratifractor salsuginis DSM 16511]
MFMPKGEEASFWWLTLGKVAAGIITLLVLFFLIKELIKMVKESNEGKCSDKCDLD